MDEKFIKPRKIKIICSICKKLRIVSTSYKNVYLEVRKEKEENSYICSDHS